jgi:hypothetical protein
MGTGYLDHTFFIDCDHLSVKDKSKELSANIEDARDKAIRLFYFVKDEHLGLLMTVLRRVMSWRAKKAIVLKRLSSLLL